MKRLTIVPKTEDSKPKYTSIGIGDLKMDIWSHGRKDLVIKSGPKLIKQRVIEKKVIEKNVNVTPFKSYELPAAIKSKTFKK